MSWITKSSLNWLQWMCINVLKCGPVPKHVAFIMDGNRRYAKKNNVEKIDGHSKGFDKLSETLQWCLDLGIKEVTVYAFSIENFKRSKDEVDALMELARQKFQRLLDEREKLMEKGVKIRIIGNWSLIPDNIVKLIAEAELITKDNNNCFLNVAFAYTARDEITHAINTVITGVNKDLLSKNDVTSQLLHQVLHTQSSPEPELLIRTSGETRLSDYLLWQASYSYLYFTDVLWPDFTAWDLMAAIFHFQRSCSTLNYAKEVRLSEELRLSKDYKNDSSYDSLHTSSSSAKHRNIGINEKARIFLQMVESDYWKCINEHMKTVNKVY